MSTQDRTKTVGFVGMVETTAQAESVIFGKGGIVEGAGKGDIHLCMSTIDPLAVKRMHGVLAERGIAMIDAPVSGGVPRAISGDLSAFAKALGMPMLLANISQQVFQMARAAGFNKEDGSATVKIVERMAGVQVGPRD
jgi:3-hydroxyisobutyrate dehydrogenase-like beta-hydroxyacid dehydrogenase